MTEEVNTVENQGSNENEVKNEGKNKIILGKKKIFYILALVVIVVLGSCLSGVLIAMKAIKQDTDEPTITTINQASLERVVEINELSTIDFTFNAVTPVYDDEGEEIIYYVAYMGIIKAGIDFDKIDIQVDDEQKLITVSVPEAKVLDTLVDAGTLDYIFMEKKFDNATVSAQAYSKCLDDIQKRANSEADLLSLAKENAISAVEGLIVPWVNQIDNTYLVKVS